MARNLAALAVFGSLSLVLSADAARGDEPAAPVRGIFVKPERLTPAFLAEWKGHGATSVLVALDERTKQRWGTVADSVDRAGMTLWPWIEVGRNPAMADAHPEWMAATGGHHADWRRRFPQAPKPKEGEVIKAWPWVPIGYAAAFDAHRDRLRSLLADLPGKWSGVFLNDLQAGPSSCGCGNDQCRWALDYGIKPTAQRIPGDEAASKLVAEIQTRLPDKGVVPVWVTECETIDLPGAPHGTGLCGTVGCAKGDCWPRYARAWNALSKVTKGPVAVAVWPETFQRDPASWIESVIPLFQRPPQDATRTTASKTVAVIQTWGKPEGTVVPLIKRVEPLSTGWVLMLDPIDQSWEPRAVPIPSSLR
jgi:hypothetical protein